MLQKDLLMYSPIILFVYNRLDHFRATYEAISKCPECSKSDLFIFSDGAKNENSVKAVNEVREYARSITSDGIFASVTLTEAPENLGLANSIINGVTKVINEYGRAIVLEDDCVASPYFLSYVNKCLEFFENDSTIGSISGFCPAFDFPEGFCDDIFLARRSCSLGWATWKDRWENVDWELKNLNDFYRHPSLVRDMNSNGSERFIRLYRQSKSERQSWSVRFGADLVRRGLLTVYPKYSYVENIGCDNTGVHQSADDAVMIKVDLSKAIPAPVIKKVKMDPAIQRLMKRKFSAGIISDIKRFTATILIVLKGKLHG